MTSSKWYNEDLKLKFANDELVSSAHRTTSGSIFSACAEIEHTFDRDIAYWDRRLIIKFLEETLSFSYRTIREKLMTINAYLTWMNSATEPITFKDLDLTTITKKEMFSSPEGLQDFFDRGFDTLSMNTSHNLIRSILWMYYIGMTKKQIYTLEESQVDIENKVIRSEGFIYKLPNEAIPCFKKCLSLDGFMIYNKTAHMRRRVPGKRFVRFFSEFKDYEQYDKDNVKNKTQKILRERNCSLDVPNIIKSGAFYRTYQLELSGVEPNFKQLLFQIFKREYTERNALVLMAVRKEYLLWKQAFYPETKM